MRFPSVSWVNVTEFTVSTVTVSESSSTVLILKSAGEETAEGFKKSLPDSTWNPSRYLFTVFTWNYKGVQISETAFHSFYSLFRIGINNLQESDKLWWIVPLSWFSCNNILSLFLQLFFYHTQRKRMFELFFQQNSTISYGSVFSLVVYVLCSHKLFNIWLLMVFEGGHSGDWNQTYLHLANGLPLNRIPSLVSLAN